MRRRRLLAGIGAASLVVAGLAVPAQARPGAEHSEVPAAPAPQLDETNASAQARRLGVRVEVLDKRTETTEVHANPNGTFTLEEHLRPIWARTATGGWARPDATLVRAADGSIQPIASTFPMSFSGGGDAPMALVRKDGTELELGWPGTLPVPTLDGDTATYANVLPGVDLRIIAAIDGFSHVLVVHHRAAAQNPALRALTLRTRTKGLDVHVDPATGAVSARNAAGRTVLGGATPRMWDATGTDQDPVALAKRELGGAGALSARQKPLGVRVQPDSLVLNTDAALLTGPDTKYPVVIDPSWSGWRNHWTLLWKEFGGTSYYDDLSVVSGDNTYGVLRAGHQSGFGDPASTIRAVVELDTSGIKGKHVLSATFRLWQSWSSKGCGNGPEAGAPVDIWHTNGISSGVVWNTAWNSSGSGWLANLGGDSKAVRRVDSTGACAPNWVRFGVTGKIQEMATGCGGGGCNAITLGLRAESETNAFSWKRYQIISSRTDPKNPVLEIDYNTVPGAVTGRAMNGDTRCVMGPGRPAIGDTTPTFTGVAHDGDNAVRGFFEWSKVDGTSAGSLTTGQVGDNAPISHTPSLSAGDWRWRVRNTDLVDNGADGEWCEFTVEPPGVANSPPLPTVTSSDFIEDDFGPKSVGEPGVLHFGPDGATDVVAYRYGFRVDALAMSVNARADGTADATITMWHDNPAEVWVQAVDRAGNVSIGPDGTPATGIKQFRFQAIGSAGPFPKERNDLNGDGKGDLTTLVDAGNGRTQIWNFTAVGGDLNDPTNVFDAPGFDPAKVKSANGDFDGDGKSDVAVLRNEGGARTTLSILKSDGNALTGFQVWDSAVSGGGLAWDWTKLRALAGDADNDGLTDVIVGYDLGPTSWQLRVFRSTSVPPALSFATPVVWESLPSDLTKIKLLAGDFTGDGRTDVAEVQDLGTRIRMWVHRSSGTTFSSQQWYDDPARSWSFNGSRFAAGDFDGNGKADIVAYYDFGNNKISPFGFYSVSGTAFNPPPLDSFDLYASPWTWSFAAWDPLDSADLDGDGDDEPLIAYRCCGPAQLKIVSYFEGLSDPFEMSSFPMWAGSVGQPGWGSTEINTGYAYKIVPSHSNKCLSVPGASTGQVQIVQKCELPAALNDDFAISQGAGYYSISPMHQLGKCLNIEGGTAANGSHLIQFPCQYTFGNDLFWFEYAGGYGDNVLVRIHPAHSGACVDVFGASTADGTGIQQWVCNTMAHQEFYLRRA